MKRLLATMLFVSLFAPGCSWVKSWGDEEPDDPAELVDFNETLDVRKIWSTGVGDGSGKKGVNLIATYDSGSIYVADHKGSLSSIDAETGRTQWQIKLKLPFSGGPGVSGQVVVIGTLDGQVLAFSTSDGSLVWDAQVTSEVLSAPASGDGIVVVRSIDGRVFGLDEKTGNRIWIYDHSVPLLTLRGDSELLVRAGIAFVGYDGGSVVALRLDDGTLIWEQTIVSPDGRTELERLADVGGQMVIVASDLIVSSYKKRVTSLAADSGRLLWFKDISSDSGVQVDRINLAVSDKDGHLWMLDRRNGSTAWKQDKMAYRGLTRPAFYGAYVVVGDAEGYLHWLESDSGEFVARVRAGKKGFSGAPVTVGTTLYVLTSNGTLSAFRAGAAL
jgi:outer membrane protein assembly factor BamB